MFIWATTLTVSQNATKDIFTVSFPLIWDMRMLKTNMAATMESFAVPRTAPNLALPHIA